MYNSFIFKKQCLESSESQQQHHKMQKRNLQYINKTRPALLQRYSRRINNFVVKLQDNKNQLYQYRQETQAKAHQLLREIERKERFLGDARIKVKDSKDWNSIFTTTDRLQMEKNRKVFQQKFGSSDIAYRSIASQSSYISGHSAQFRHRQKSKEIHANNMTFTAKFDLFSNNKKLSLLKKRSFSSVHTKAENKERDYILKRISTQNSRSYDDEMKLANHSFDNLAGQSKMDDHEQAMSIHREHSNHPNPPQEINTKNKVYFKTVIDIQQNSRQPKVKKAIRQILVRFGISRIKDIKKQALAQTDNLQSDGFE